MDQARLHSRRHSRQFESRETNRRFEINLAGSARFSSGCADERRFAPLRPGIAAVSSFARSQESPHALRRCDRPHHSPAKPLDMPDKMKSRSRRAIPAVTNILDSLGPIELPRPLIVDLVRRELTQIRRQRRIPEFTAVVDLVRASLENLRASRIQPLINGTGIVIHTNLGRAPLPQGAGEVLRNVASSYNNLELDLATGDRGDRAGYLERALAVLCQAEAAGIVNNCAAALVLITRHFVRKLDRLNRSSCEVVISRGELVQIGGGFRIGDKLCGVPQAGIIVGKKRLITALKAEPLFRALRCDKLVFAALQTTVDLHLNQVLSEIPALALLQIPKDELRARAAAMVTRLQGLPVKITIGTGAAKVGGGTLPQSIVPSITIDFLPENSSLEDFARTLRRSSPPVTGYIAGGRFKLDLRTIFSHQDDLVIDAIRTACT